MFLLVFSQDILAYMAIYIKLESISILYAEGVSTAMELLNACYVNVNPCQCHGITFLDKVLESFNNSHMSQWTYFDH